MLILRMCLLNDTNDNLQNVVFDLRTNPNLSLFAASAMSILSLIFIIMGKFFQKQMKTIIKLFDKACYAIFCIPCVLLQPLTTLLAFIILMFCFFVIVYYINTLGVPIVDKRMFGDFQPNNSMLVRALLVGHIVGSYFLWQFVTACAEIIVAGAVAE